MSARRTSPRGASRLLVLAALAAAGYAPAEDDADEPDLEFLEYLGSWEAGEEDWLIFAGEREAEDGPDEEGNDESAPGGERLAEENDEE